MAEVAAKRIVKKDIDPTVEAMANDPAKQQLFGEAIYKANCASCHGLDGKKGLGGASDLSTSQLDVAGLKQVIVNGRNSMAPFNSVLSEKEIEAVSNYTTTLKQ